MDENDDFVRRTSSGSAMTTWGIVVLVMSFLGTCVAGMSSAGQGDSAARGFELGQSPILILAIGAGIALIAVGQARKSNARRAMEERIRESNTTVELVPDPDVPGGPFRGGHKEVEKLDPDFAAAEAAEQARTRSRGNGYLIAGGVVLGLTTLLMLRAFFSDEGSPREQAERILVALGLGVFPFGLGLFLTIKGLLLRSK
jgi:hypothetical protein